MKSELPQVLLHPKREASLMRRHPWVFSGAIASIKGKPMDGDLVGVSSSQGELIGTGFFSDSSIAVKMISFSGETDLNALLRERIELACKLRRSLGLLDSKHTTGFRLVNAEGDGLPGLIVDLYSDTAVAQFHGPGPWRLREEIVAALRAALGGRISAVYNKSKDLFEGQSEKAENEYLFGQANSTQFSENNLIFSADWENGQKTGFYLDQRDNRALLGSLSAGRNVLNCFSYTGGFSCYALANQAKHVTSVDSSAQALKILEENLRLNGLQSRHTALNADCMQFLHNLEQAYDLVVLDPPAFIKHRGALRGGIKGYETINHLAIKQIASGGILFTFSCSQLLSRDDFVDVVSRAALRAGRAARIIYELRQAPCHCVSAFHPEGNYLKGLAMEIV